MTRGLALPPGMARDLAVLTGDCMTTGDIAIEIAAKPVYARRNGVEVPPFDISGWLARCRPAGVDGPRQYQPPFIGGRQA